MSGTTVGDRGGTTMADRGEHDDSASDASNPLQSGSTGNEKPIKPHLRLIKPHLRSTFAYLTTYANLMDYFRYVFYFFGVYGHRKQVWWAMPLAILMNGLIDDFDGKVARAMDQCSKFGYIIDCACDNIAVATNTGCIAHLALLRAADMPASPPPSGAPLASFYYFLAFALYVYASFFMFWSALASVCMGLTPNYKRFHRSPWATWYYGTWQGDAALFLGMQLWWALLYLALLPADGAPASTGTFFDGCARFGLAITTPLVLIKVSIELENVYLMTTFLRDAEAKQCADLAGSVSADPKASAQWEAAAGTSDPHPAVAFKGGSKSE